MSQVPPQGPGPMPGPPGPGGWGKPPMSPSEERTWGSAAHWSAFVGAFVALALWLPQYMVGLYGVDVKVAGMLAAKLLQLQQD